MEPRETNPAMLKALDDITAMAAEHSAFERRCAADPEIIRLRRVIADNQPGIAASATGTRVGLATFAWLGSEQNERAVAAKKALRERRRQLLSTPELRRAS